MKRGLKGFSRAVRDGKIEESEERLESIVQGDMNDEEWKGYHWALKGMVKALDSDSDLSLARQIAEDKIGMEKARKLKEEMEEKSSQGFRPGYERGYNSAWSDVLQVIIEDADGK